MRTEIQNISEHVAELKCSHIFENILMLSKKAVALWVCTRGGWVQSAECSGLPAAAGAAPRPVNTRAVT